MMISIEWNKWKIKILERYHESNDNEVHTDADIIFCSNRSEIGQERGPYTLHKKFKSLHIHLPLQETDLWRDLNRTTRYKINRAKKRDQLRYHISEQPTDEEINQFCAYYDRFSKQKGIQRCHKEKLIALREHSALTITRIEDHHEQIICFHVYVVDGVRAFMLYSASHFRLSDDQQFRSMVSRANCLLHWEDILYFKTKGYLIYDFGGLALNQKDTALNQISQFKKGFGGEEVFAYKSYYGRSWLGKWVLLVLRMKWSKNPELYKVRESYESTTSVCD